MKNKVTFSEVNTFLAGCSDTMMRYIELQTAFAKDVRTYMLEYDVSEEEFASEYGCPIDQVALLRCGGCEVSIKDMATMRTLWANRIAKENAQLKVTNK